MDKKAYSVVRILKYVEIITTETKDDDAARDEILEMVKNHKTDGSTFKLVSQTDYIGQILDTNV